MILYAQAVQLRVGKKWHDCPSNYWCSAQICRTGERKRDPVAASRVRPCAEMAAFVSTGSKPYVLFGSASRSAPAVDRSRTFIPLGCITGAIPGQKTPKGKTMSNNTKPAAKVTLYPITAAIWRNETAKGSAYSVTIQHSYEDAEGKLESSDSLNEIDLLLAAKVLDLAHTETSKFRANNRHAQQPDDHAA
jgi:hypothetical protein